jgi:broad specificity phosphatase PhoE
MKPDRIIIVRHGQSIGNVDKSVYKNIPDYAIPLTSMGIQQATDVGKSIRSLVGTQSVKFYVSPFWRTRQTYQCIVKAFPSHIKNEKTFYEDPRLREQEWCGRLRKEGYGAELESERSAYGNFYFRFDRGESCADTFDRISGFLDTLHRDFKKPTMARNCVIVTHGMTLRVFLMRFFHLTVEEFEKLKNPKNGQMVVLQLVGKKYKLLTPLEEYTKRTHAYQFDWSAEI